MVRCKVCGGPAHLSTLGSGFNNPVLVHSNREDWIDNPHNVCCPGRWSGFDVIIQAPDRKTTLLEVSGATTAMRAQYPKVGATLIGQGTTLPNGDLGSQVTYTLDGHSQQGMLDLGIGPVMPSRPRCCSPSRPSWARSSRRITLRMASSRWVARTSSGTMPTGSSMASPGSPCWPSGRTSATSSTSWPGCFPGAARAIAAARPCAGSWSVSWASRRPPSLKANLDIPKDPQAMYEAMKELAELHNPARHQQVALRDFDEVP